MVLPKISTNIIPTISDFDVNQNIKSSYILNEFQKIAGKHAELLNGNFEYMKKNFNSYWVLSRIYVEFSRQPKIEENLKLETWPLKPNFAQYIRNYTISTEDEEIICKAKSLWLIIDMDTKKIKTSSVLTYPVECAEDNTELPTPLKLFPEDNSEFIYNFTVKLAEIDYNNHVNNAKYGDYLLNAFSSKELLGKKINSFQINYLSQIKENDNIDIYRKCVSHNKYIVEGKNEGKSLFISSIQFK